MDNSRFRRTARQSTLTIKGMTSSIVQGMGGSVVAIGAVGVAIAGVAVGVKLAGFAFRKMTDAARQGFRFMLTAARGFNKEMHASLAIMGMTVKDPKRNQQNMTHVGDVLVKANTLANASVEQFSESLTNKAGAALRLLNKDIEEGVAVLAVYADQGIKGAEAGTALGIVLRDLQTKAIKNAEKFREAGVRVYDAGGQMRNMADIVEDLENKLGGLSDKAKKATLLDLGFSDKSVAFIQALIGTSGKIRDYETALRNARGTMAEVASKQMPALTRAWEKLKAVGEAVAVVAIVPMLDSLGETVDDLIPPFENAVNMIKIFAAETVYAFRTAYEWANRYARTTNPIGYMMVPELPEGFRERTNALRVSMSQPVNINTITPEEKNTAEVKGKVQRTDLAAIEDTLAAAAKKLKKAISSAMKEGERVTLNLLKPMEIFRNSVSKLKYLLHLKAITPETYARGLKDAESKLRSSTPTPANGDRKRTTFARPKHAAKMPCGL